MVMPGKKITTLLHGIMPVSKFYKNTNIMFKPFALVKLLCFVLLLCCLRANAAKIDTVLTHSNSMHKDIKAVVITPDAYKRHNKYPVIYLLHGFSGNYTDWISKVPAIAQLADEYHTIIVCPDGNYAGWYFNSPVNKDMNYETYIADELVGYIDTHYATITDRSGRAITGLSMGGHGALYLAIRHQNTFGAAGSMSGCVDLPLFSKRYGLSQVLGEYDSNPQRWKDNSVTYIVENLQPNALSLIFDCGYSDDFYASNLAMHQKMIEKHIPHDFIARTGGHSWEYWGNSIVYQVLFFSRYFNQAHLAN
jgi:S-formylglutathione hydrolase FrmB